MASEADKVVMEFMLGCGVDWETTCKAYRDHMAEDFLWIQKGMPDIHGVEQSLAWLSKLAGEKGVGGWRIEILAMADRGDTVLMERIDHCFHQDGEFFGSYPVVGIFHVRDGKIWKWTEYPDFVAMGLPMFEETLESEPWTPK